MSFFKKLKDRMFRSSARLDEGIEAAVAQSAPESAAGEAAEAVRPGLIGRLVGAVPKAPDAPRRLIDDAMLERLEEVLIEADMGVDTATRVIANLAEGRFGKRLSVAEIKAALSGEIARIMAPVARPLPLYPQKPQVVLVVGVNGSGKTTTIGKLASQFRSAGKTVMIAAGDTFRAAAVEQLQIWGDRTGATVVAAEKHGGDAAGLAFDALTRARGENYDVLLIDTAGRLHNKTALMDELRKVVRVIKRVDETAPHSVLLVLDATTGQNAVQQAKIFGEMVDVTGIAVTKLDGSAKGGVVVALAQQFAIPLHMVGVGEGADDLRPFDARDFARGLVGLD